jgi:hypothetical protein
MCKPRLRARIISAVCPLYRASGLQNVQNVQNAIKTLRTLLPLSFDCNPRLCSGAWPDAYKRSSHTTPFYRASGFKNLQNAVKTLRILLPLSHVTATRWYAQAWPEAGNPHTALFLKNRENASLSGGRADYREKRPERKLRANSGGKSSSL